MGDGERGEEKVGEIEGKQGDDGGDAWTNGETKIRGRLRRGTAGINGGLGGRLRC